MQPQGPVAWHRFATLADASEALAEAVAIRLRALLAGQGRASLAVPGGTTPARFLAALGTCDLAWDKVTLLPTDERFVAADDPASNERMIRTHFAPLREGRVGFLSFHGRGQDIEAAAAALASDLASQPPLDLVISGMGTDGHIAAPPGLPPRLSLSPARLAGAGWASLLVSGAQKEAVLKAALDRSVPLPVDILIDRPQGLDVYWAKE